MYVLHSMPHGHARLRARISPLVQKLASWLKAGKNIGDRSGREGLHRRRRAAGAQLERTCTWRRPCGVYGWAPRQGRVDVYKGPMQLPCSTPHIAHSPSSCSLCCSFLPSSTSELGGDTTASLVRSPDPDPLLLAYPSILRSGRKLV